MNNVARRLAYLVAAALIMSGCAASQVATPSPSIGSTPSAQASSQASPTPSALASAAVSEPALHSGEPWIAYQWTRAGGDGIYLVRPDGTDAHELLPDAEFNAYHPDWSPDDQPRSPSTPKPVEATRSGSSTRMGPTPRRSCDEAATARSVAAKLPLTGLVTRRFEARVRPVSTPRERSRGSCHRSPGRRQR